jgi:phosphate transport system protein
MERELEEELDRLKQLLLDMAARVEHNIDGAIEALRNRDPEALEKVIREDTEVDLAELQVDEACISLLALRQPVARDLRFIVTALKIVKDIERIGDIAKNIAKHGLGLARGQPLSIPGELGRMAKMARQLLGSSLDAFVRQDVELARQVIREDDPLDELHKRNVRHFIDQMVADPRVIGPVTQFLSINKFLERIGDHSKNIAAMVVFMIEGQDVRHPKKQLANLTLTRPLG